MGIKYHTPFSTFLILTSISLLLVFNVQVQAADEVPDGLQFAIAKARLLESLDTEKDGFGSSTSISGDWAIVGAPNADSDDSDVNGLGIGAAYIFNWSGGEWVLVAELLPGDGANNDQFGQSVDLSGDRAVVGAPSNDNAGGVNAGAAYVFKRTGGSWVQEEKLLASNGHANNNFGGSVSIDGLAILVGANKGDLSVTDSGTAYFYEWSGVTWLLYEILEPPAGGAAGDFFGSAVSLSGGRALIGAYGDDENGALAGAAYVFDSADHWSSEKLLPEDASAGDWFGWKVSLDGQRALVSTSHDNSEDGLISDTGSAYVFDKGVTHWAETQKLYPSDNASFFRFGSSVSLSGDRAVIGNYGDTFSISIGIGSAYVFDLNKSTGDWEESKKLFADDGIGRDEFGRAVAVDGDRIFVGAPKQDVAGEDAGAAYAFTSSGSDWAQSQKLLVHPLDFDEHFFGHSVSIFGGMALVGAYGNDEFGENAGSAVIFKQDEDGTWIHTETLYASDAQAGDQFGFSVGLTDNYAIVGANLEDTAGPDAGAAYIFEYVASAPTPYWRQDQKLTAGTASSEFGFSTAIHLNRAIVGAPFSQGTGAAYYFHNNDISWVRTELISTAIVSGDNYGYSVDVDSSLALVGANGDGFNNPNQGAAYIFEWDIVHNNWGPPLKLTGSVGHKWDAFGHSVSLTANRALVGAPYDDDSNGAAYVFDYEGGSWPESQRLLPELPDTGTYDRFGWSVSVYNDKALVGAYEDNDGGDNAGAAYVFDLLEDVWLMSVKFIATDIDASDNFGYSVSVSLGNMLVGAPNQDNENGGNAGVAYVYIQQGQVIFEDGFEAIDP